MDVFRLLLMALALAAAALGLAKAWIEYRATKAKQKETNESGDAPQRNPRS